MIVLDIETISENPNDIVVNPQDQKITYVGVVDCETGEELSFWEKDLEALEKLIRKADIIVGYNLVFFDMPVIAKYFGQDINQLPMLDLMIAAKAKIGFRPKLNNLSNATLGRGKLGSGMDAARYFMSKDFESLKKYCLEDVRLTRELYDYGEKTKKIKYFDRNGFLKETEIDWSLGFKNYGKQKITENAVDDTLSLF